MRALALGSLVLALGCFEPTIRPGLSCAATGVCPAGQICDPSSMRCSAERLELDAATPTDSGADSGSGGPFCEQSGLIVCLELNGVVTDDGPGAADVDVKGTLSFVAGHRDLALAGSQDATIEIREVYADNPRSLTYELWIAAGSIDGLILSDQRLAIEIMEEELSLTSRRDGSFLRFGPLPADRFFHVAYLVTDDTAMLYIDGLEVEAAAVLTETPDKSSVFLTNDGETGTAPLSGAVDDVRIWSRLLGPAEIAAAAARHRDH